MGEGGFDDINWTFFGDATDEIIHANRYPEAVDATTKIFVPGFDTVKEFEDWVTEFLDTAPKGVIAAIYKFANKRLGISLNGADDLIREYQKGLKK